MRIWRYYAYIYSIFLTGRAVACLLVRAAYSSLLALLLTMAATSIVWAQMEATLATPARAPHTPTPPPTKPTPPTTPTITAAGIIIPLYENPPSADFNTVISLKKAHPRVPLYVILNANSGPGTSASSAYTTAISQLQSVGAIVIGYVYTSYGARATATVENDVYSWKHFYPAINGIFFDEMSASTNKVSYYAALTSYVHNSGMTASFGNPGEETPEVFFQDKAPWTIS